MSAQAEARRLGRGRTSYNLAALLTRETTSGAMQANIGASWHHNRDEADLSIGSLRLSLALLWNTRGPWRPAVEVGDEFARSHFAHPAAIQAVGNDREIAAGAMRSRERGEQAAS